MRLGVGELIVIFIEIGFIVASLVATWKIVSKAGYTGALSLLALVPVLNFVMLFVFAFSEWPVLRELRDAKAANIPAEAFKRG